MLDKIMGIAGSSPQSFAQSFFSPIRSTSGIVMTEERALTYSAVFSAVKVISETVAILPWRHLRHDGKTREVLSGTVVDTLLHREPNAEMTSFQWREYAMASALLHGNAYSEIEFNAAGEPVGLWPIAPSRVEPKRNESGDLVYAVTGDSGGVVTIPARQMFHLRGPTRDGVVGWSVISLARESWGLGIATEQFASAFFANGAVPSLLITQGVDAPKLDREGADNLIKTFEARNKGSLRAGKVHLMERGFDLTSIGVPQADAQFLETRKHGVTEVARWFRVPPHKIADMEKSTFSNIESQERNFVNDAILPWVTRLEQESNAKLLDNAAESTKLNVRGILRGDSKARGEYYTKLRDLGVLSINEIRELEDMNPIDGGDLRLVPLNMVPLKNVGKGSSTTTTTTTTAAARAAVIDAHNRMARKEINATANAAKAGKHAEEWARDFYSRHSVHIAESLMPAAIVVASCCGTDSADVAAIVERHSSECIAAALNMIARVGLRAYAARGVDTESLTDLLIGRIVEASCV